MSVVTGKVGMQLRMPMQLSEQMRMGWKWDGNQNGVVRSFVIGGRGLYLSAESETSWWSNACAHGEEGLITVCKCVRDVCSRRGVSRQ